MKMQLVFVTALILVYINEFSLLFSVSLEMDFFFLMLNIYSGHSSRRR